MYARKKMSKKFLKVNKSYDAETIEYKIQRLVKNKEPLDGGTALTYTERKDGVLAETNIRTDKFEIAAEAMDKYSRHKRTVRAEREKGKLIGIDEVPNNLKESQA